MPEWLIRLATKQDSPQVQAVEREAGVSIRDMVSGRVDKDLSDLENRKRDLSERQSCIQAHARLIFDWEGNAYPCCVDIAQTLKLGSINENSIKEIFNSHEARKLRDALKTKAAFCSGTCKNCSSFESYKGYKAPWGS
jgi:radical SAM protein with 4Fe4S-binding SPASM domain